MNARTTQPLIVMDEGTLSISLGTMEIWGNGDLVRMRESLEPILSDVPPEGITIDMQYVKMLPSGFFGELYDLYEAGITVRLHQPQPHVKKMIWFRRFIELKSEETFQFRVTLASFLEKRETPPVVYSEATNTDAPGEEPMDSHRFSSRVHSSYVLASAEGQ